MAKARLPSHRTAQKWINWAHDLEAEAARLREFGHGHAAQAVERASVALGDTGRAVNLVRYALNHGNLEDPT